MKISPRSKKPKDDTAKDHFIATMSIGYRRCVPAFKNSQNKSGSNLSSSPLLFQMLAKVEKTQRLFGFLGNPRLHHHSIFLALL